MLNPEGREGVANGKRETMRDKRFSLRARDIDFLYFNFIGKWFEPRSLSRLCGLIVWVRVVLRRTVVGDTDRRFDNLSGSHHQSHVNCVSSLFDENLAIVTLFKEKEEERQQFVDVFPNVICHEYMLLLS